VGDTVAGLVYAYDYDAAARAATGRRVLSDHRLLDGAPDGAAVDSDGHVWSCVLRSGRLAELSTHGVVRTIEMPMANPSDVAFGGRNLDQLFVTSIALDLGDGDPGEEAGRILAIDDTGAVGRPEPRFAL
jgi:sugar lactone lactonase YvrE